MFKGLAFSALLMLVPVSALAQTPISVGGSVGAVLENKNDWKLYGGEARIGISGTTMEVSPRFTYRPLPGGNLTQIDVNLLDNFELAHPGIIRPYAGVGGAFSRLSFGSFSQSKTGLNIVSGMRFITSEDSAFQPFFNTQYTVTRQFENAFAVVVGVVVKVR